MKSSLATESLALLEAAQASNYIRHFISEVLGMKLVIKCYVDNRSLVEAVHSTKAVEDKHLIIDIAALKDLLVIREVASVSWVLLKGQLTNVLT